MLLVLLIVFGPAIARRVGAGGDELRLTFAATALRMFSLSPVVGTGPGTWVILRPTVTLPSEQDFYVPHAHDVPAQTLGELGLVGALAGVVLVANLAWFLAGAIRGEDPGRRRWAWLTLAGLLYFALHQLLDFYANLPGLLFRFGAADLHRRSVGAERRSEDPDDQRSQAGDWQATRGIGRN